jgi:hypothetical protein
MSCVRRSDGSCAACARSPARRSAVWQCSAALTATDHRASVTWPPGSACHDLEGDGLVSRRPDPTDRRRAFVELTAAGRDLLLTTRAGRESWLTDVLERELDPDERVLLHDALVLLRRIADA